MGKVKRNAPCPCGSGKKYKKCCGSKVVDFPTELAAKEAKQIQEDLVEYAFTVHRESISSFINQHDFLSAMDRQTKDISVFNLGIWESSSTRLLVKRQSLKSTFRKKAIRLLVRKRVRSLNHGRA